MRSEKENNRVIAYLEGSISSGNSEEVQKDLETLLEGNPGCELVLDAGELIYISSAGLRVLLLLSKRQESLTVRNVSRDVYDIMEMTGFTSILNVVRKMREISIDGCKVIGHGAIGTVYRLDEDTIVKVYELPDSLPMIENEQKMARQAFLKGIPTAISYDIVRVGDKYGCVFELLKANTFLDMMLSEPEKKEEILLQYAHFIRQVHKVEMDRGDLPEARIIFLEQLKALREIIPAEMWQRAAELLEAMPENLHLVHGDIQMKNVMCSSGEPLLIDMDTLSVGDPVFDLMSLYDTYVLFNEDEPGNGMVFHGLSNDMCYWIWEKVRDAYLEGLDEASVSLADKKIQIVSRIRFLYQLHIMGIGDPELKQIRTEHTLQHLREDLPQVDSLTISS